MTKTDWLWVSLGWFSLPLLGVLGGVFLWRRLYRELPLFFSYLLAAFLVGSIRLVTYRLGTPRAYFLVYWYSDFVLVMTALLAIYEVFLRRLFPKFHKVRLYRFLFPGAVCAVALLAFLTAAHSPDRNLAFAAISRSFDFLRSAVIGFFAAITLLMGRGFAGFEFWIAAGFGIQAAVALANAALRTRLPHATAVLDAIEIITYDLACLIWLIAFWKPEKRTEFLAADQLDPEMLHQARSWETLLKNWLTPGRSKR